MLHGIGRPVRRKEDLPFITGRGRYTADISLPDQLHLAVYRAPVAHATINSIDTTTARAAEGVVAVIVAEDLAAGGIKDMRTVWPLVSKDGSPMRDHYQPVLATGKMAYFGEPVAAVVAESAILAKDAAELIEVDYEALPAVAEASDAIKPGAAQIWDEVPGNLACDWGYGDKDAVDQAFGVAAHVVAIDAIQNRLVPSAIEPRAALASYDAAKDGYTLYLANQNPHLTRFLSCRDTVDIPEHKLRIIAPDVGGGFGSKTPQYSEEYLCLFATKATGRPVKWVSDRSEAFLSDAQARDHVTHAEMALDANGRILAIRSRHVANVGAYIRIVGAQVPTMLYALMLSGVYTIPAMYAEVKVAFTNTVPFDAYRGAGRPEAAFTVERLVETAAQVTGIDPLELRRRNFIPKDAFPYASCGGLVYDSGDYAQCLGVTLKAADLASFESRRDASIARGKLRGLGIAMYTEMAGLSPTPPAVAAGSQMPFYEATTVRVNPDGTVTVLTGSHSHGQGHDTTFAQVVAEKLSLPLDDIDVVHGDTGKIPFGVGTFGSRSIAIGGGALAVSLDKVVAKAQKIAAHILASQPEDVEFIDGYFKVKDSDPILSFKEIAHMAYLPGNYPIEALEPGLEETSYFDPEGFCFPSGCHCCELEIDPETGAVELLNYCVGDDFGVIINPMIVAGQVHGGLAQGIGQALMEHAIYDKDSAQLITGSFLDYCMPRADDLPSFHVETIDATTPTNPLGAKGCGEAGTIAAPGTIMNAVFDALRPAGVTQITMPATSQKIWEALREGKK